MSNNLEQLIQPGEQIYYQSRQRWLCSESAPFVAINLCCLAFLGAAGLITIDLASLLAVASVYSSLVWFMLRDYPRNAPSEAMVTNRRLVQRCGLFDPQVIEVPVATVKDVAAHEDGLLIFKRDGTAIKIDHPSSSFRLGIALARAAKVSPPAVPRRLVSVMDNLWFTCIVLTSLAIGVAVLKWLFLSFGATIFSFSLIVGVGALALGGFLANVAGVFVGPLLLLVLTRPLLSYDRFRLWMDDSYIFWPDPDDDEYGDCLCDVQLWYADWLYLRPSADAEQHR